MQGYPDQRLFGIAKENYQILQHYCSILEGEGYWLHPSSVLQRSIGSFLSMYVQAMVIQLCAYLDVSDAPTVRFAAELTDENLFHIVDCFSDEIVAEAKKLVTAPPILLQLCSLRDVEKHSSMTGLFFDALLNILFAAAYTDGREDMTVTRYIREYYGRIQMFIRNVNSYGACVDEKYIFHKICMGELAENTALLKQAGEDFERYKREAFSFSEAVEAQIPETSDVFTDVTEDEKEKTDMDEAADTEEALEKVKKTAMVENSAELKAQKERETAAAIRSFRALRLEKLMRRLDELVGMQDVKEEMNSLVNLIRVRKMRQEHHLPAMPMSYHMVFTGNPGTGKTTVARLVGEIYRELGVLSRGVLIETDRAGLVAGYVGQTAIKVKEVVEKAKGGVLFIDEAYTLSGNSNGNDFGGEAIDTLVKLMEDYRDDLVVIVAGYTKEMESFLRSNTGLVSRFNKFIEFPDYSDEELLEIMDGMAAKAGFRIVPETRAAVNEYLDRMPSEKKEKFGNARGIRNLFEKMVSSQANRIILVEEPTVEELTELLPEDCRFLG